jgi:hypothetical protein
MAPASSSRVKATPRPTPRPKSQREVTPYATLVEVISVPDTDDENEEEEDEEEEEEEVEEVELDTVARSSAPAPSRKSKGGDPTPISSSSAASVPIPRSFRERLATSCLVNIPRAPPQFTVEFLEAEVAKLAHHVEKLGPRLAGLEAPDWEPNLLPTIPPFERPTAVPPIDYSGAPEIPDAVAVNIPAELPSSAPISEQRARLEEIRRLQKEADVLREEHLNSMTARENFEEWCREEQPARFWKDVAVQERAHADRVRRRDADNFKCANEPARIRNRFERTNALYEDYKGRLEEERSRSDQIQCGIRALLSLLDEVRHLYNLIRAVGHEDLLGEYLDLVMDLLHLDSPAHNMVYERIPGSTPGLIRIPPANPASSLLLKKRGRDDPVSSAPAAGPSLSRLIPNVTFDHDSFSDFLEGHKGIKTTLKTLVGTSRIKRGRVSFPFQQHRVLANSRLLRLFLGLRTVRP